jgi:histidyl-tRNA synthetase
VMGVAGADTLDDDEADNGVSLLPSLLSEFGPAGAAHVAEDLLARANLSLDGGSRSPEDIVRRLLTKAGRADPTERVRQAADFILRLRDVAGPPPEVFGRLETLLAEHGLDRAPLREIERSLALFERYSVAEPEIVVDLSLGRGLRYYTGLVFEMHHSGVSGTASQICGGGRYDDLVRALGGRGAVPACGFSFGLERVSLALEAEAERTVEQRPTDALVVPLAAEDEPETVILAQELRTAGLTVELDVRLRGVKLNLRHADREGIPLVVIYGEREHQQGVAVVRDMRARSEAAVERGALVELVRGAL